MNSQPEILVGIAGSIASYKAVDVVSDLVKRGAKVTVVMTPAAVNFVSPLTLKNLSGRPVGVDLFDEPQEWGVGHVTLPRRARAFVIVGATADLLARLAGGFANDFVTACALVNRSPFLLAPAMHTEMWEHPAVRENVKTLVKRGAVLIGPVDGPLSSGDSGMGRMAEPADIAAAAWSAAMDTPAGASPLAGKHLLITAGPTREAVDPVRFLSNPSSGRMGYALATEAARRGASVTLVSGPVSLEVPRGVELVNVTTALQMHQACLEAWPSSVGIIAAAAVSDFRPATVHGQKVKKTGEEENIKLVPNPDILKELSQQKGKRVLVGFAAETENLLANAKAKMKSKNLDMIVANTVGEGRGFESTQNQATLILKDSKPIESGKISKAELACRILDQVEILIQKSDREARV